MVITTAAAATNRTAIAAVSTVMQVANVLISRSRRAPKAARWAGTVGIAGRKSIGNALLNAYAQGTHTDRLEPTESAAYSAALAKKAARSMVKPSASQNNSASI
jgi:hypothetical protein